MSIEQEREKFASVCNSLHDERIDALTKARMLVTQNHEEIDTIDGTIISATQINKEISLEMFKFWPSYVTQSFPNGSTAGQEQKQEQEPDTESVENQNSHEHPELPELSIDLGSFSKTLFDLEKLCKFKAFPLPIAHGAIRTVFENALSQQFLSLPVFDVPIKTPLLYLLLRGVKFSRSSARISPIIPLREAITFYSSIFHYYQLISGDISPKVGEPCEHCRKFGKPASCTHGISLSITGNENHELIKSLWVQHQNRIRSFGEGLYLKLLRLPFCSSLNEIILNEDTNGDRSFKISELLPEIIDGISEEFIECHQKGYINSYLRSLERLIWEMFNFPMLPGTDTVPFFWDNDFVPTSIVRKELVADCLKNTVETLKWKNMAVGRTPSGEHSFDIRNARECIDNKELLSDRMPISKLAAVQMCAYIFRLEAKERKNTLSEQVIVPMKE